MHRSPRNNRQSSATAIPKPFRGVDSDRCASLEAKIGSRLIHDAAIWKSSCVRVFVLFVICSVVSTANGQDGAGPSPPNLVAGEVAAESETKPADSDAVKRTDEFRPLLSETFESEWLFFPSDPTAPSVWSLRKETMAENDTNQELMLVCSGAVKGFAYTKEKFGDFELKMEWRFPKDASGNSGVLVFTQAEPRIWPTSIQLQLHQPTAGSLISSGDAKTEVIQDAESSLARPVGEWNECRIVCNRGTVTVEINGKKAGQVTGATPSSGSIALQSEGSEVHFRRIRVRSIATESTPLPSRTTSSAVIAAPSPGKEPDQKSCS